MVRGALIGTGVALLCLLPPLLHFILGPLGPLIGGFVGGSNARSRSTSPMAPVGVAALMALFVPGVAAVVFLPSYTLVRVFMEAPDIGAGVIGLGVVLGAIYTFLLALLGAVLGVMTRGRQLASAADGLPVTAAAINERTADPGGSPVTPA